MHLSKTKIELLKLLGANGSKSTRDLALLAVNVPSLLGKNDDEKWKSVVAYFSQMYRTNPELLERTSKIVQRSIKTNGSFRCFEYRLSDKGYEFLKSLESEEVVRVDSFPRVSSVFALGDYYSLKS